MNKTSHALLPKKLLSATMYRLARIKQRYVKNFTIRLFMVFTGANLDGAKRKNYKDYDSLLDFFTRELEENSRPVFAADNAIVSPVDGRVTHVGDVKDGQIFQIKGHSYALDYLVGEDYAKDYQKGQATTIYLAPFDYHRVHSPLSGKLKRGRYIPGELNSVSISFLDNITGLFAKNERVVLEFERRRGGSFLMVLVGAVNVGSIETVFHGEVCPNDFSSQLDLSAQGEAISKGQEIGRFNLGSTIILIMPPNQIAWQLKNGQKVSMGEKIGQLKERVDV